MSIQKTLVVFMLLFVSISTSSQNNRKTLLGAYLKHLNTENKFSGEVLIATDKDIFYQQAIGVSSIEHQVPLQIGGKYNIASVSKSFTSALIAIAHTEGKLDYEDFVNKHIEDLSDKFKKITIKQLLNHSSGLPHNEGIANYWQIKSKIEMDRNQIIDEINKLDLVFESGSKMKYSSLGYYLLAHILEEIYNKNYDDILANKILNIINLKETGTVNTLQIIPKRVSGYHIINGDSLVTAPYRNYSLLKGAGDLYSTTADLLHFNASFFSNELLPEHEKEFMLAPQIKSSKGGYYAMGWYTNASKNKIYHGGGTWGFSCHNTVYPKQKLSFIILSNVSTLNISSIAENIEKIFFDEPFEIPKVASTVPINSVDLNSYTGIYQSESSDMILKISKNESNLFLKLGGNPSFIIYPKNDFEFYGKKVAITINFKKNQKEITGLIAKRADQNFTFKKTSK